MKKKILFILHIPPPVNGAAMVGKFLVESEKINKTFDTDFTNLTTSFSLQKIGKGGFAKGIIILKVLRNVFKALWKKDYDLCYMTLTAKGAGFYKDFLIVVLLKLFRKKIVYHFHNKGVEKSSHTKLNHLLYTYAFKNTKSIVLSSTLSKDIEKYVQKRTIFICPNGIPDIQSQALTETTENKNQLCKFLFLSNMMQEKGVIVLLEACKLLKQRNILFECHFIGAWSDVTEIEFNKTVMDFELNKYVFAHGKKYGNDKLHFFRNTDIFVFPTFYHNECFPLVLLEAMQQSLPIVSTPEGGIVDLVSNGKTGILVMQRDVEALTDQLQLLVENEGLRNEYGNAGRERYEQFFTLTSFENRFCTILEEILATTT